MGLMRILLSKGLVALVDAEDFDSLSKYKWRALSGRGINYAARYSVKDGKKGVVLMHRQILNAPNGSEVDHRNGDGLDNQRTNLRFATRSQQGANTKKSRNPKTSIYKGVRREQSGSPRPWQSRITVEGKAIYLGRFTTEIEAAESYDRAATKYFKQYAKTNFTSF
jgi:hypothetical protein